MGIKLYYEFTESVSLVLGVSWKWDIRFTKQR